MSVAILLITHEHIAHNMLKTAESILSRSIENIAYVEIPMDAPTDPIKLAASKKLQQLHTVDGIIILTDLTGSTPFNISKQIQAECPGAILLSGLNLPMLLKLTNYRELPLAELAEKTLTGGQSGITSYG